MKSFRFRLRRLKDYREQLKQERAIELARVESRMEALSSREAALLRERALRIERQNAFRQTTVLPASEVVFSSYLAHLDRQAAELRSLAAACEAERERARVALMEAARELRALEKLEARRRAEHDHEELRQDTKLLDESGRDRFQRAAPASDPV